MSRFRLRYRNTDLEMPLGELVVGRASTCHLALDDALVSRRHALLRCSKDEVVVEDLGSRNGVVVNGVRITGPRRLEHGDRVTIGEHEIRLLDRQAASSNQPGRESGRLGTDSVRRNAYKTAELDLAQLAASSAGETEGSRELGAFRLLAGIAEKSLGLARFDEAERILGPHLEGALERARRGEPLDPEVFAKCVDYSLRLCEGPRGARFISYVIDLHGAMRRLMAEPAIDRLHELVRKARYRERGPIDAYVGLLESMSVELSATDRFVVRRVAALQRVITA
jgi:hypothetical protein